MVTQTTKCVTGDADFAVLPGKRLNLVYRKASVLRRTHIALLFFLAVIYLSSCSLAEYVVNENAAETQPAPPSTIGGHTGPTGLASIWVGKNVSELVDGLGQPDMMMDALPRGAGFSDGICKYIYVYMPKPGAESQCIRAYVIDDLSGEVIKFRCR